MTLTLKLTATAAATGAGAGVNFNRDLAAHLTDFTPYQMPLFLNATGQTETTQIVHLATPQAGQESATRFVALGGDDFYYTFSNHSVSGTIRSLAFGTLGAAWDATAGDIALTGGLMTTASTRIAITGLEIENARGVKGDVHALVLGMMGGGLNGTEADGTPITEAIWGQAHRLIGSAGADTYRGTRFGDTVQGGAGADTLDGAAGRDRLTGGAGADSLSGGAAADTILGQSGADRLFGGSGADSLSGGAGADALFGGAGRDHLIGGAGADRLQGGTGADRLTGGGGADTFVFASKAQIAGDRITDFGTMSGDVIDLTAIDANSRKAGNQAFDWIGTDAFSGTAGELRMVRSGGDTRVLGDLDGDGQADFRLVLTGSPALIAPDFLL